MTTKHLPPVLFLADKLGYPSGVSFGGTTYFVNVLPALRRAGVDLTTCFLREPHPAVAQLRERGVEPVFLSVHKWNPLGASAVVRLARERGCRLIHAAGMKATLVARMAARAWPMRVLVHVHDMDRPGLLVGAAHRAFASPHDFGLCVSRAVSSAAREGYRIVPERIRVLPNGLDLGRFRDVPAGTPQRLRAELDIAPERPVLAMFARMYPVKGHRLMLAMLRDIVREMPDVLLLLAGDGPERSACEQLVAEYQLGGNVRFLGHRADIPELLTVARIFLMPSQSEGMPLAGIEAMAQGVPVVGFDVGGMSEVIEHGINGLLAPAGAAREFVAAVLSLLREPGRRAQLGQAAYHAADRFSVESHVQGLLRCYDEALAVAGDTIGVPAARRT